MTSTQRKISRALIKSAALFLSSCLPFSELHIYAAPLAASFDAGSSAPRRLETDGLFGAPEFIPSSFGRARFFEPVNGKPLVVHIETDHGNYGTQESIRAILEHAAQTRGVDLILLEGGWGKLERDLLSITPDRPETNGKILESLARGGLVKGAELFLSGVPDVPAFGIENARDYLENGIALKEYLPLKSAGLEEAAKLKDFIEEIMNSSLNPALKDFFNRRRLYAENPAALDAGIRYLSSKASELLALNLADPAHQIDWPMTSRMLRLLASGAENMKAASAEKEAFLEAAAPHMTSGPAREVYSRLSEFLRPESPREFPDHPDTGLFFDRLTNHLPEGFEFSRFEKFNSAVTQKILRSEIDAGELFLEIEKLEEKIFSSLVRTEDEKELLSIFKSTERLEKLLRLEVTPRDLEALFRPSEFLRPLEELVSLRGIKKECCGRFDRLDFFYDKASRYYLAARRRDAALAANALEMIDLRKARTAVVITGGFHAGRLRESFRKAGKGYILITPRGPGLETQSPYYEIVEKGFFAPPGSAAWELPLMSQPGRPYSQQYLARKIAEAAVEVLAAEGITHYRGPVLSAQAAGEGGLYKVVFKKDGLLPGLPEISISARAADSGISAGARSELRARRPALDRQLVQKALASGRIEREDMPPSLARFMDFLERENLGKIVVMGGAVKDIFWRRDPKDLDTGLLLELEEAERERMRTTVAAANERIMAASEEARGKLAGALDAEPEDLRPRHGSEGARVFFEKKEVQYTGPERVPQSGRDILHKGFIADPAARETYFWNTAPALAVMAIDPAGNLYGHKGPLEDLLQGRARIAGDGRNFVLSNILRMLRLKHIEGLEIPAEDEQLMLEASSVPRIRAPGLQMKELVREILKKSGNRKEAVRDLVKYGITNERGGIRSELRSKRTAFFLPAVLAAGIAGFSAEASLAARQEAAQDADAGAPKALSIPDLIGQLKSEDAAERNEAERRLLEHGNAAVGPLMQAFKSPDAVLRTRAAEILGQMGKQAARPLVEATLYERDLAVRRYAVLALGHLRDPDTEKYLIRLLADRDPPLRYLSAWALGRLQSQNAVLQLTQLLDDGDERVRRASMQALAAIFEASRILDQRIYIFSRMLRDSHESVVLSALEIIEKHRWYSAAAELSSLAEKEGKAGEAASRLLGEWGVNAAESLGKQLNDPRTVEKEKVAKALEKMPSEWSAKYLVPYYYSTGRIEEAARFPREAARTAIESMDRAFEFGAAASAIDLWARATAAVRREKGIGLDKPESRALHRVIDAYMNHAGSGTAEERNALAVLTFYEESIDLIAHRLPETEQTRQHLKALLLHFDKPRAEFYAEILTGDVSKAFAVEGAEDIFLDIYRDSNRFTFQSKVMEYAGGLSDPAKFPFLRRLYEREIITAESYLQYLLRIAEQNALPGEINAGHLMEIYRGGSSQAKLLVVKLAQHRSAGIPIAEIIKDTVNASGFTISRDSEAEALRLAGKSSDPAALQYIMAKLQTPSFGQDGVAEAAKEAALEAGAPLLPLLRARLEAQLGAGYGVSESLLEIAAELDAEWTADFMLQWLIKTPEPLPENPYTYSYGDDYRIRGQWKTFIDTLSKIQTPKAVFYSRLFAGQPVLAAQTPGASSRARELFNDKSSRHKEKAYEVLKALKQAAWRDFFSVQWSEHPMRSLFVLFAGGVTGLIVLAAGAWAAYYAFVWGNIFLANLGLPLSQRILSRMYPHLGTGAGEKPDTVIRKHALKALAAPGFKASPEVKALILRIFLSYTNQEIMSGKEPAGFMAAADAASLTVNDQIPEHTLIGYLGASSKKVLDGAALMLSRKDSPLASYYSLLYYGNLEEAMAIQGAERFTASALDHPNTRIHTAAAQGLLLLPKIGTETRTAIEAKIRSFTSEHLGKTRNEFFIALIRAASRFRLEASINGILGFYSDDSAQINQNLDAALKDTPYRKPGFYRALLTGAVKPAAKEPNARAWALEAMNHESAKIRGSAIRLLIEIGERGKDFQESVVRGIQRMASQREFDSVLQRELQAYIFFIVDMRLTQASDPLISLLNHWDPGVRNRAGEAVKSLGTPEAEFYRSLMQADLEAAAEMDPSGKLLLDALLSPDDTTVYSALRLLSSKPSLTDEMQGLVLSLHRRAKMSENLLVLFAKLLSKTVRDEAADILEMYTANSIKSVSVQAARSLEELSRSLPRAAFHHYMRLGDYEALAAHPNARDFISELFSSDVPAERKKALTILGKHYAAVWKSANRTGGLDDFPAEILKGFFDPAEEVRSAAKEALVPYKVSQAGERDGSLRAHVYDRMMQDTGPAFSKAKDPRITPFLFELLYHPSGKVSKRAEALLADYGHGAEAAEISKALDDPAPGVPAWLSALPAASRPYAGVFLAARLRNLHPALIEQQFETRTRTETNYDNYNYYETEVEYQEEVGEPGRQKAENKITALLSYLEFLGPYGSLAVPELLLIIKNHFDRKSAETAAVRTLAAVSTAVNIPLLVELMKKNKGYRPLLLPGFQRISPIRAAGWSAIYSNSPDTDFVPYFTEEIERELPHLDKESKRNAAIVLGASKNLSSLPYLLAGENAPTAFTEDRALATSYLGGYKSNGAVVWNLSYRLFEDLPAAHAAAKALEELKDPRAAPFLIFALKKHMGRPPQDYLPFLSALSILGDESLLAYLDKLVDLIATQDSALSKTVIRILIRLHKKSESAFTPEIWRRIRANLNLLAIVHILNEEKEFLSFMKDIPAGAVNMGKAVLKEAEYYPEDEKDKLITNLITAIETYAKDAGEDAKQAEYDEIASYLNIVHDNLALVLQAVKNTGYSLQALSPLRRVLPLNNPLTRILRMLGEQKTIVGGYLDVINRIKQSGKFPLFFELVVDIAQSRQRAAPQEVGGMLEILRQTQGIEAWTDADWREFRDLIRRYYDSGFKVITLTFFEYFRRHAGDPAQISEMKEDMTRELGNIGWGGFMGLSESFKKKYGITVPDELALLARYLTIKNSTARDYETLYKNVKSALQERGKEWQEELDPPLRDLYQMGGYREITAYDPSKAPDLDRTSLHQRLTGYAQGEPPSLEEAAKAFAEDPVRGADLLKRAAVLFTIKNSQLDWQNLTTLPKGEEAARKWIGAWIQLFEDSYKQDSAPHLRAVVREALDDFPEEVLEKLLEREKIPGLVSIAGKNELFKVDNAMAAIAAGGGSSQEKIDAMSDLFYRTWMARIRTEDLSDKPFNDWLNAGGGPDRKTALQKFAAKLAKKAKERDPSVTEEDVLIITGAALAQARRKKLSELKGLSTAERLRVMLAGKMVQNAMSVFEADVSALKQEAAAYITTYRKSADVYYVGVFDDLLHLMGCMMSGVCTASERPNQVRNKGFHFAKMALKRADGRVLGLSQVQFVKAGIASASYRASAKGWRVMALPGVNIDHGTIGMSKERAVYGILEAAQRFAEGAGLEGAVIPTQGGINSNDPEVHRIFNSFRSKGWLVPGKLTDNIRLSAGYSYTDVWIVNIPEKEFVLQKADLEDRVKEEEDEARKMEEEERFALAEGLGELVLPKAAEQALKDRLRQSAEQSLAGVNTAILETLKINASSKDVALSLRYDPGAGTTAVQKSDGAVELIIGNDLIYAPGQVETTGLGEWISEWLAAFILEDYAELKEKSQTDENAYFKLENLKALLGYREYLERYHKTLHRYNWNPSTFLSGKSEAERRSISSKYKADLGRFTEGVEQILQWNLFLNVMDDADPGFLTWNYVHILTARGILDDADMLQELISKIASRNIDQEVSLSALRNGIKELYLAGTARVRIGEEVRSKERFSHFDKTERLVELKDILLTTKNQNEFYQTMGIVLKELLPADDKEIQEEILALIDRKIFDSAEREAGVRGAVQEYLAKKIGTKSFNAVREHLTAQRGTKQIPYIHISEHDLEAGEDADAYGSAEYESDDGIDYALVFASDDTVRDWVTDLFPFPQSEEGDEGEGLERSELRRADPPEQPSRAGIEVSFRVYRAEMLPIGYYGIYGRHELVEILTGLLGRQAYSEEAGIAPGTVRKILLPGTGRWYPARAFESALAASSGDVIIDADWIEAMAARNPAAFYRMIKALDRSGGESGESGITVLGGREILRTVRNAVMNKNSGLSAEDRREASLLFSEERLEKTVKVITAENLGDHVLRENFGSVLLSGSGLEASGDSGPAPVEFILDPEDLQSEDLGALLFLIPALRNAAEKIRGINDLRLRHQTLRNAITEILPGAQFDEGRFAIRLESYIEQAVLAQGWIERSA